MPVCRTLPQAPQKSAAYEETSKNVYANVMYEPNFSNAGTKYNCPPNNKNIYTWVSSPRAIYNTKKFVKTQMR